MYSCDAEPYRNIAHSLKAKSRWQVKVHQAIPPIPLLTFNYGGSIRTGMLPQWIIEKKRDGRPLSEEDLEYFIGGYVSGSIPDYQMSALAMAIYFRGMTSAETASLTRVMMLSGDLVDTSAIKLSKIDKHSTGGIGDKVSIALAPLVASCGVAVPMISGRGLGITGGTLDKLESIPGYRTRITELEFLKIIDKCGCSIAGQTKRLVPADRMLYALRDVTGTVPSIPLIVASIMSKKLAAGLDGLVLDVKCGSGAFMSTTRDARALAKALLSVANSMGKRAIALITNMNQPLGRTAGNSLEVIEAADILKGCGPDDTTDLTLALGANMLLLSRTVRSEASALKLLRNKLASGEAFERFLEMIRLHGGDRSVITDPSRFKTAPYQRPVRAEAEGRISAVDAGQIGRACLLLGAGRTHVTDNINHEVGISQMKKTGETVSIGEPLAVIHATDASALAAARNLVKQAFHLTRQHVSPPRLVLAKLSGAS